MSGQVGDGRPGRVPPLPELRTIAQGMKTAADRRWTYRLFRAVSIYITWALLHTRATPNQVTVVSLVVAGVGLVMVALPGAGLAITGCILLLVYHLLDRVDGELARVQERYSLLGVYLDNAGHYLTSGGVLVAASFRLAELAADPRIVWLVGSVGALAAVMSRIEKHAAFHLFAQYVMSHPQLADTVKSGIGPLTKEILDESRAASGSPKRGALAIARDLILILTWFPVAVVILLAAFVVEAAGFEGWGRIALYLVAGLQILAYAGIELANLSGNLGSETRRLRRQAGLSDEKDY